MSVFSKRQYLVVGGTRMLAPLCQSLPPKQPITAARFLSNQSQVTAFTDEVMAVALDYDNDCLKAAFLKSLSQWATLN